MQEDGVSSLLGWRGCGDSTRYSPWIKPTSFFRSTCCEYRFLRICRCQLQCSWPTRWEPCPLPSGSHPCAPNLTAICPWSELYSVQPGWQQFHLTAFFLILSHLDSFHTRQSLPSSFDNVFLREHQGLRCPQDRGDQECGPAEGWGGPASHQGLALF